MNQSEQINELAKALALFQAKMPAVLMNATNPFLKNKYADLGAVIETAIPYTSEFGLSFSQLTFSDDVRIGVETVLMHTSGQWISSAVSLPLGEEKGKTLAQVAGSVITYLRRYSLGSILGIYTEEDKDGEEKKRAAQKKEVTPEEKERTETISKIIEMAAKLGGQKNNDLMTLVKNYEPSANPNKMKDLPKVKELYSKLLQLEKETKK